MRLFLQGEPVGKARPRVVHGSQGVRAFTPEPTRAWEESMEWQAIAACRQLDVGLPLDGRLLVRQVFYLPRPKSVTRTTPTVKPDLDNLSKATLDALENAGIIINDSRVTDLHLSKRYADEHPAGVAVEITTWTT